MPVVLPGAVVVPVLRLPLRLLLQPRPGLSSVPDVLQPVGARLRLFLPRWKGLFPQQKWALAVVEEGLRLSFHTHPSLSRSPAWISVPKDPVKALALRQEVQSLLQNVQ